MTFGKLVPLRFITGEGNKYHHFTVFDVNGGESRTLPRPMFCCDEQVPRRCPVSGLSGPAVRRPAPAAVRGPSRRLPGPSSLCATQVVLLLDLGGLGSGQGHKATLLELEHRHKNSRVGCPLPGSLHPAPWTCGRLKCLFPLFSFFSDYSLLILSLSLSRSLSLSLSFFF